MLILQILGILVVLLSFFILLQLNQISGAVSEHGYNIQRHVAKLEKLDSIWENVERISGKLDDLTRH
jgi:hypothetical protein